jgi:hypothetical protein
MTETKMTLRTPQEETKPTMKMLEQNRAARAAGFLILAFSLPSLPCILVSQAAFAGDGVARVRQPVMPQEQPPKEPLKEAEDKFQSLYTAIIAKTGKDTPPEEWEKLATEARQWSQKDIRNPVFYLLAARCYTEAKKMEPAREWLEVGKAVFNSGPIERTAPAKWQRKALLAETLYRFAATFRTDLKSQAKKTADEAGAYGNALAKDMDSGLKGAGENRAAWGNLAERYRAVVAEARTAWETSEPTTIAAQPNGNNGTNAVGRPKFDLQDWFKTDPKTMGVWEYGYVQLSAPTFVRFDERIVSPEMKVIGGEPTPGGAWVWRVKDNRRPCIVFNNTDKPIPIALAVWTSEGENQPQKPETIWQPGEVYLCPIAGKVSAAVAWKCPSAGKYKVRVQVAAEGTDVLVGNKKVDMAIYLVRGALSPQSLSAPKVLKQVGQPVEATLTSDQVMKVGERVYVIVDSKPNSAEVWARVRVTISPASE